MRILFDIGGTKMRLAVSRDGRTFEEPRIVDTPRDFGMGMKLFCETVRELAGGKEIEALGGGVAGPLNRKKNALLNSPHLPDWIGKPIRGELEKAFRVPVRLENDTALVGLGEAVAGAGAGNRIVAYVTISTGVNGVRIVDGKIDEHAIGFEIGHQVIDIDGPECGGCRGRGHLEAFVSGSAMEKKYGKKPYEITDASVWDEAAWLLAYGLNNTIVHWSPDIVVLGGSMMKKIGIPVERVRFHLKEIMTIFPEIPQIEKASLGDIGGLHGALIFLRQSLNEGKGWEK